MQGESRSAIQNGATYNFPEFMLLVIGFLPLDVDSKGFVQLMLAWHCFCSQLAHTRLKLPLKQPHISAL